MKNITTLLTFILISFSLYSQGWKLSSPNLFEVTFGNNTYKEVNITVLSQTNPTQFELELSLDGRSLSQYNFNTPSFDCHISYNPVNKEGDGFELREGPSPTSLQVNGATIMGNKVHLVGFFEPGNSITIDFYLVNFSFGTCFNNPNNPGNEYPIPNNNNIHSLKINFIGHSVTSMDPYENIIIPFEVCTPIVEGQHYFLVYLTQRLLLYMTYSLKELII